MPPAKYREGSARRRLLALGVFGAVACALLMRSARTDAAAPAALVRSFAFPASYANAVVGDLVPPTGTASTLSFQIGKVAIGELPIPMPLRNVRAARSRVPKFMRLSTT